MIRQTSLTCRPRTACTIGRSFSDKGTSRTWLQRMVRCDAHRALMAGASARGPKACCHPCGLSPQHQLHRVWLQALLHELAHQLGLLSACKEKQNGERLQRLPDLWGCARPFPARLHTAEISQSGHPDTTNCPLLLHRIIQLSLPTCSKGLISTSPEDKRCCCGSSKIHAGPSSPAGRATLGQFWPQHGELSGALSSREATALSENSAGNQPCLPFLSISHPNSHEFTCPDKTSTIPLWLGDKCLPEDSTLQLGPPFLLDATHSPSCQLPEAAVPPTSPSHLPPAPAGLQPPGPDRRAGNTWSKMK